MDDTSSAIDRIEAGLQRITNEGGNGNFLIAESSDYYVQFAGDPQADGIYMEAVSKNYVPEIKPEVEKTLSLLGFTSTNEESGTGNWALDRDVNENSLRELAELAVVVLCDLYGVKPSSIELEIYLEDVPTLQSAFSQTLEGLAEKIDFISFLIMITAVAHLTGLIDLNESIIFQALRDLVGI